MTTPFTYYLFHKPTGLKYYGVRYKKGCQPSDLWNIYFSSSKKVKLLIEEYGVNSFNYEIRKIFDDSKKAIKWETKVLQKLKVTKNENWINQSIGCFPWEYKHSEETKRKIAEAQIGEKNHMYGKTHTKEVRQKIAEAGKRPCKEETKLKISKGNKGNKKWLGKFHSQESINKIKEARKLQIFSEESKKKMSESAKGRKWKTCPETGKRVFYRENAYVNI